MQVCKDRPYRSAHWLRVRSPAFPGRERRQRDAKWRYGIAERPGGQIISNAYDFAGRLVGVSWPGGGISTRYENESGRLAAITAQDGEGVAFTYDVPLLTGVALSGTVAGSISYAYDTQFRVRKMTYRGPTQFPNYDPYLPGCPSRRLCSAGGVTTIAVGLYVRFC